MQASWSRYEWEPSGEDSEVKVYRVLAEIWEHEIEDVSWQIRNQVCRFHHKSRGHPLYGLMVEEISTEPLDDECLDFCEWTCVDRCGGDDGCFNECMGKCEGDG